MKVALDRFLRMPLGIALEEFDALFPNDSKPLEALEKVEYESFVIYADTPDTPLAFKPYIAPDAPDKSPAQVAVIPPPLESVAGTIRACGFGSSVEIEAMELSKQTGVHPDLILHSLELKYGLKE